MSAIAPSPDAPPVQNTRSRTKSYYNLAATAISGMIVGSSIIYLAYKIGPEPNIYPVTYLICIMGYILGWIIAIISTPMNQSDETDLGKFTKVIGSFLTGFILSKLDKILEQIFDPTQVLQSIHGARLLLFGCCFGLTFILVFYYRRYKWKMGQ